MKSKETIAKLRNTYGFRMQRTYYIQVPLRPEAKSWRIIPAKRTTTGNREKFDECG